MKKQYRSSIIKRKYRCRKEDMDHDQLEKAKKYLEEKGYADHVIELEESSATVQLAAEPSV